MIIRKLPIIIRMNGMIFVLLWMKLSISNAKIYSHLNVMGKVNFTLVALPFCIAGIHFGIAFDMLLFTSSECAVAIWLWSVGSRGCSRISDSCVSVVVASASATI